MQGRESAMQRLHLGVIDRYFWWWWLGIMSVSPGKLYLRCHVDEYDIFY